MSQGYAVDDYVHLYIKDATKTDDFYTWHIPGSYYTNRRSRVCTVECVGGTIQPTVAYPSDGFGHGLVINYCNGGQNAFSSGNVQAALCHASKGSDYDTSFNTTSGIQILVDARPQQITLKITTAEGTTVQGTVPVHGCLSLKFSYYNALETGEQLHSQYTPTLS